MSTIKKCKLTAYSTGLAIGEGSYSSLADVWIGLSKLSEKNIIAVLWVYLTHELIFMNEIDFSNQSCKKVSDPNSFLYILNKRK